MFKMFLIVWFIITWFFVNADYEHSKRWCSELYNNTYPESDGVTKDCKMTVHPNDVNGFARNITKSDFRLNFWTITLKFQTAEGLNLNSTKMDCVVQPLQWIWTYPGEYGAIERLSWPQSFKLWSLGTLDVDSQYNPQETRILVQSNCIISVGQMNTTERIGLALITMLNSTHFTRILDKRSEIRFSYFCYTEQIWINTSLIYHLCLHIVCPMKFTQRKCCRTVNDNDNRNHVVCEAKPIDQNDIWWYYPYIISLIMFAYFPLILLKIICTFSCTIDRNQNDYGSIKHSSKIFKIPKGWLLSNPISVFNFLQRPFLYCHSRQTKVCSKIIKVIAVFFSLSVITIEIIASYKFEYDFVEVGSKQGIPMNFVTILAGFHTSRKLFLHYFGGPYIAICVYIVSLVLLLCVPAKFENIIENGISDNPGLSNMLLNLDLQTKGKLGGIYNLHHHRGYKKFFNLLKSHIFMLTNPDFLFLGLSLQFYRLKCFVDRFQMKPLIVIGLLVTFPLYVVLCVLEWTLIIVYFSVPVLSFFAIVIQGFWNSLRQSISSKLRIVLFPFVALIMLYDIYIFSVVFVESFLFVSRIFVFTLTGFIAYPNETYVYIVFFLTIAMYVVETIHSVRLIYDYLFRRIQAASKILCSEKLFPKVHLLRKQGESLLLSEDVFYFVLYRYRPVRIEMCFSALKFLLLVTVIYLAISMIVSFKSFSNMESLTQVFTVLFICLFPKFWNKLWHTENHLRVMKENEKIRKIVVDYCTQKIVPKTDEICDLESINHNETSNLINVCTVSPDESEDELLLDSLMDKQ